MVTIYDMIFSLVRQGIERSAAVYIYSYFPLLSGAPGRRGFYTASQLGPWGCRRGAGPGLDFGYSTPRLRRVVERPGAYALANFPAISELAPLLPTCRISGKKPRTSPPGGFSGNPPVDFMGNLARPRLTYRMRPSEISAACQSRGGVGRRGGGGPYDFGD